MLRSIDLSRAGMLRQQRSLDATAHNIANSATPGFKALRTALESGDGGPAPVDEASAPALTAYARVGRQLTQGPLRATGMMTDFAVEGEGYFVVRRPDGSAGYTRNGAFHLDAGGQVVDGGGNVVQPATTVPPGATGLRVGADGTVTVSLQGGANQTIGQVRLARFANPHGLAAGADGLFAATPASGAARIVAPGQDGTGRVHAGVLESTNAELSDQLTDMLGAQRAFQLNTSAFRMADDMLRIATQMAGTT
ncbi:MAG: flagellar hook basal-body protein [Dehalococcoidia bacterium]